MEMLSLYFAVFVCAVCELNALPLDVSNLEELPEEATSPRDILEGLVSRPTLLTILPSPFFLTLSPEARRHQHRLLRQTCMRLACH